MMDPRKLLYFATIVEQGSFNKAAKLLVTSQPALDIDGPVRNQSGRKGARTQPGRCHADAAWSIAVRLCASHPEELCRAEQGLTSDEPREDVISLGTPPGLAISILPSTVSVWRQTHALPLLRVVEKNHLDLQPSAICTAR